MANRRTTQAVATILMGFSCIAFLWRFLEMMLYGSAQASTEDSVVFILSIAAGLGAYALGRFHGRADCKPILPEIGTYPTKEEVVVIRAMEAAGCKILREDSLGTVWCTDQGECFRVNVEEA